MALHPVRIMSATSPIAVTLRSRIMVLLPSIAHTGARLLSPFDFASQTSLASQHESTGALPLMPGCREFAPDEREVPGRLALGRGYRSTPALLALSGGIHPCFAKFCER